MQKEGTGNEKIVVLFVIIVSQLIGWLIKFKFYKLIVCTFVTGIAFSIFMFISAIWFPEITGVREDTS